MPSSTLRNWTSQSGKRRTTPLTNWRWHRSRTKPHSRVNRPTSSTKRESKPISKAMSSRWRPSSRRKVKMAETQTAAPAAVETPVPLSEQEITETYLEARAEGKVEDLPIPPPTIPEGVPEPPKLVDETPAPPEVVAIQETDTYIEGRKERKDVKRKS